MPTDTGRPPRRTLEVACALIERDGRLLAVQRSAAMSLPLKWEFPGGKIEPGETPGQGLRRELREELGVEVEVGEPLPSAAHDYPAFSVVLHPRRCRITAGELTLHEHAAARWLAPGELYSVDWAAADLPVLEAWSRRLRGPVAAVLRRVAAKPPLSPFAKGGGTILPFAKVGEG